MGPRSARGHRRFGLGPPVSAPYGGRLLLVDKSAWERQAHTEVRDEWRAALQTDQLVLCSISDFELLYSARDSVGYAAIEKRLAGFRHLPMTETVHRAALTAMRELAKAGRHRVKLPDLLIAACAQEAGAGVLHYDHDFDLLSNTLAFDSRWIAAPGALD